MKRQARKPKSRAKQTSRKAEVPADARTQAVKIRREWMELMGYSPDEIAEACAEASIDLQEEQEQLHYAQKLREITPRHAVLESWSIKH